MDVVHVRQRFELPPLTLNYSLQSWVYVVADQMPRDGEEGSEDDVVAASVDEVGDLVDYKELDVFQREGMLKVKVLYPLK